MSHSEKKENKPTVSEVLKLANQLSPEEQDELVEQIKLAWLKREVQKGIDELDRGEYVDGEELIEELLVRAESRLKKSQQ